MLGPSDQANIYTSFEGIAQLRHQAQKNDPKALDRVARQFEAIFLQMMLKSMRDAGFEEGLFDNNQSRLFLDMYDKQIAQDMSQNSGIGLAEMMIKQLQGLVPAAQGDNPAVQGMVPTAVPERGLNRFELQPKPSVENPVADTRETVKPLDKADKSTGKVQKAVVFDGPESFVRSLWPEAERAAKQLGVDPQLLIAQAALETGWGKYVIKDSQGNSSFNLFNIKADQRWKGAQMTKQTLEYHDGVMHKEKAQFRAYDSYADSFRDYVNFLQSSGRYRDALKLAKDPDAFIEALHKAGYATDPAYADKVKSILKGRVLADAGTALKLSTNGTLS